MKTWNTIGLIIATGALSLLNHSAANAQGVSDRTFYPDGKVSQVIWSTDNLVHIIRYHENGKVRERGSYLEGKAHGRWIQKDDQGRRTCTARYDHGCRTGDWRMRTLEGVTLRLTYCENELVRGEEYSPEGDLIAVQEEIR